jgi:hypothetical protein
MHPLVCAHTSGASPAQAPVMAGGCLAVLAVGGAVGGAVVGGAVFGGVIVGGVDLGIAEAFPAGGTAVDRLCPLQAGANITATSASTGHLHNFRMSIVQA